MGVERFVNHVAKSKVAQGAFAGAVLFAAAGFGRVSRTESAPAPTLICTEVKKMEVKGVAPIIIPENTYATLLSNPNSKTPETTITAEACMVTKPLGPDAKIHLDAKIITPVPGTTTQMPAPGADKHYSSTSTFVNLEGNTWQVTGGTFNRPQSK